NRRCARPAAHCRPASKTCPCLASTCRRKARASVWIWFSPDVRAPASACPAPRPCRLGSVPAPAMFLLCPPRPPRGVRHFVSFSTASSCHHHLAEHARFHVIEQMAVVGPAPQCIGHHAVRDPLRRLHIDGL